MIERTTQVDGQQIRYLEEGDGPPIVLLHGASLGSSGDVFARNMGPLTAGGLRAIAPDRPGYGLSDGPGDASLAGHRRFILGFLDALGIDSAVLVGHSQQSNPAAVLTLEQPGRVPQAVILGGGGLLPPLPGDDDAAGGGERLTSEPTLEQTRAHLEGDLYNHDLITPQALELRNRMSRGRAFVFYSERPAGRPGAAPAGAGEPLWKRVGANPERLLLIYGRQDKPTTAQRCERALELFPALNLVLLDRCAHLVQWDQADEFVRRTLAFVREGVPAA
jgi:2-hydroxy-6-oxonona-2,4-dienedioate hydrolase/4,5:9,10-diseco-3-hydroxy-5,9,17-trioxoandrosta-1(10),2-diene-4-oate hydrolase